ncbi:hypothetical protein QYF36_008062 [Acer negundo]|nr:hypothetical protein QYF36_008062 [Acer negundo]
MAVSLIFFSVLLIFLSVPVTSQLNELFFPGFKDFGKNLTLKGVAEIENNGILRLTNHTSRLQGELEVPKIVGAPDALDGGNNGKDVVDGFDDFMNSFASSSFEKMTSQSFQENSAPYASLSTSPLSLLYGRGETR